MKQIKTLIFHNLYKERTQFISFGIILCLSAFIINLALILSSQMQSAYDSEFDRLNTANIAICSVNKPSGDIDKIIERLEKEDSVQIVEERNALMAEATAKEFFGTDFTMNTLFLNNKDERTLNKYEMIEESDVDSITNMNILIPRYISEFGGYDCGSKMTYRIGDTDYNFNVAGKIQEMQFGNYGTGLIGVYLPDKTYNILKDKIADKEVNLYSVKLNSGFDSKLVCEEVKDIFDEMDCSILYSNTDIVNKQSRTMVSNLVVYILLAFAAIVIIVILFLCRFRIRNKVNEEMANMGVLKAIGYTGKMVIYSVVLPYVIVGIVTSLAGVILSYLIMPMLANLLTIQSGFGFTVVLDIFPGILTAIVLTAAIFVITYFAACCIKHVRPIHAIRGDVDGKKVKKNYFAMDKTGGNIHVVIILKELVGGIRQNVLLFIVTFVMMILISFAGTLFYNVIVKPNNFTCTLAEENPDIIVQTNNDDSKSFKESVKKDSNVGQILEYETKKAKIAGDSTTLFCCEDYSKVNNDLCYKGKNPVKDDEIAIGSIYESKYDIGDSIKLTIDDKASVYKVVGYVQSVNYSGNVCEIIQSGLDSFYIYLDKETDAGKYIDELDKEHDGQIIKSVNYREVFETSGEMYSGIVKGIIIAVFILTTLIIFLILYVIIKAMIVERKQEIGIYKSIGYSGRQLVFHISGGFIPVTALASISSALLGCLYLPYTNGLIFSMVGAIKNYCEVSAVILIIFAFVQILLSFIISMCLALPVKKISAYSLIKE